MKGPIVHNSHAYVHGVAMCVGWQDESVNLSELIFRTVRTALDDSGHAIHDIDSVVLAAHDVVDGRSLSSMVTAPAAGAYLKDETRLAEDGLAAVSLGSARIEADESQLCLVAAWGRASEGNYPHTSRFALDPFLVQPFGLDEFGLSSLRLSEWMSRHGEHREARERAAQARSDRARRNPRSVRECVRPPVQLPMRACEAPRLADIVVATVLGKRRASVRIGGVGHSAETGVLGDRTLASLTGLREAVQRARGPSGAPIGQMDVLQLAGPALSDEALALEALGVALPGDGFDAYAENENVNPSGGAESGWCFPTTGLVNFVEAYLQLTGRAGGVQTTGASRRALVTGVSPIGAQIAHAVILEAA